MDITDTNEPIRNNRSKNRNLRDERRPFIAWDGEGINDDDGQHHYILFGNSRGDYIQDSRLSTIDIFALLKQARYDHASAIHISYAFDYDVNMIISDLPWRQLYRLKETGDAFYYGYRIEWKPNKFFQLSWRENPDDKERKAILVWDIFSFFGGSFVSALTDYLGDIPALSKITEGKQARGDFHYSQVDSYIKPYWQAELDAMVQLANKLRDNLLEAGYPITKWHGPGAVASLMFNQHETDSVRADAPDDIGHAIRCAYAGGRFELHAVGHTEQPVYEYDIRSAYPYAISMLPNLAAGQWEYISNPTDAEIRTFRFAIYHVVYYARTPFAPGHLFRRNDKGKITYPHYVEGWYHAPEVASMLSHPEITVDGAWVLHVDDSYPFQWVRELYETRQQWKREGRPAQHAIKLGLNSMYGKMAQQKGWEETFRQHGRPPRWHQLDYAGFVTAYCRMMVRYLALIAYNRNGLVSIETDAVFSTVELDDFVTLSQELGQWEKITHYGMTTIQSGLYYVRDENGEWHSKIRGLDSNSLSHNDVLSIYSIPTETMYERDIGLTGETTRFNGLHKALHTDRSRWQRWETQQIKLAPGDRYKRTHSHKMCPNCSNGETLADSLHQTVNTGESGVSSEHHVAWLNQESLTAETLFGVPYV